MSLTDRNAASAVPQSRPAALPALPPGRPLRRALPRRTAAGPRPTQPSSARGYGATMRENGAATDPGLRAPPGLPAPVPAPRHCDMAAAARLFLCLLAAPSAVFALSSVAAAVPRLRTRKTAGPGGAAGAGWLSSFPAAEREGRIRPGFPGPGLRLLARARLPPGRCVESQALGADAVLQPGLLPARASAGL